MKRINIYSVKLIKESGALYQLKTRTIRMPEDAYAAVKEVFCLHESPVEQFGIFSLNTKNDIVGAHILHVGSVDSTPVDPKVVFQHCLLNNAASFVCFHNHPSQNPEPSSEDILMTKRLIQAGEIMGIPCLDHVIVGEHKFVSLKERGCL